MNAQTIAKTIIQQLGGNRFASMTGAKDFIYSNNKDETVSLHFGIPGTLTKNKANRVKITLAHNDTYTVEYLKSRKVKGVPTVKSITVHENIYCDMLVDNFETETGLFTHF